MKTKETPKWIKKLETEEVTEAKRVLNENYDYQKGIEEFMDKVGIEYYKETPTPLETSITEKSHLSENVKKIGIDRMFDFNVTPKELISYAAKALHQPKLLSITLQHFRIHTLFYTENKAVLIIKIMPFFMGIKNKLYNQTSLHPTTVFIFDFLSHF